jgi:hypothetical protein
MWEYRASFLRMVKLSIAFMTFIRKGLRNVGTIMYYNAYLVVLVAIGSDESEAELLRSTYSTHIRSYHRDVRKKFATR